MKYLYNCPECKQTETIEKHNSLSSSEEKCKTCKTVMNRIYTSSGIKTSDGVKGARH